MEGTAGLQDGFVDPAAATDAADHGAVGAGDDLLGAGGQLHPGPLGVGVVSDDGSVVSAGPGELAAVTGLLLEVADNSSLGHVADGHHVTDGEVCLLATVDELTGVHT